MYVLYIMNVSIIYNIYNYVLYTYIYILINIQLRNEGIRIMNIGLVLRCLLLVKNLDYFDLNF